MTRLQAIKPRTWWILLTLVVILFFSYIIYPNVRKMNWNPECHRSFHEFAYLLPRRSEYEFEVMLPPAPWQAETSSSELQENGDTGTLYSTAAARTVEGDAEIWVNIVSDSFGYAYHLPRFHAGKEGFAIYRPQSSEWEVVSDRVSDTDLYVVNLLVDSNGAIWGQTWWDRNSLYHERDTVPILSRFNEDTRQFEFAEGVLEILLVRDQNYFGYTQVVLDAHDIFWIVTDNGDIYRYDPIALTTDLAGHVPSAVRYATLSPDGSIYFLRYNPDDMVLYLEGTSLFQFSPETGDTTLIQYPSSIQKWAFPSGLLVDQSGQLWLGAIGYRDLDENWNLIDPTYLNTHNEHLGQYPYAAPQIMFESSDGRLWYQKYLDTGGWGEGTAWYDPATDTGCMFTNQFTNVVEDAEQQIWVVVDGVLYRYSLNT